jgi:phosphoribosyl-AMP cyclohydrolase
VKTGTQFINVVPRLCGDKSGCPITDFGHDKIKTEVYPQTLNKLKYVVFLKHIQGGAMLPALKYDDRGLIPAIVQDVKNSEVLMMAYMNEASLEKTLETGKTCFWSRSRQQFWTKGETSGNVQLVNEILYDCDADTLLIKVEQVGKGACHTGNRTCFYRKIGKDSRQ